MSRARTRAPRPPAGRTPAGEAGAALHVLLRVAIYIRISTDEEHQPFSLEAQEAKLRAYLASQPDWAFHVLYKDEASGASVERPDLQRALAAARAGEFDVLLVYRVDRLSRSLRGLVHILDDLDAAKVAFRSATEPFDTSTPVGRMLVQMLGVFAQFERATIIDRVINGMERKAAKGQWCGGYRPYGYELDPAVSMLAPNEREAPLIPVIFRLYTTDRLGAKAVAARLNHSGHRTKTGRRWSAPSVLTVLRNRVYLGEVFFRGTWYRADPHHPALIDEDTFTQAQQILAARGDDRSRRAANASGYLLAGKVICGYCGRRYQGTAATGNTGRRYPYYTCFTRNRYGIHACDADRLPADTLHRAVLEALAGAVAGTGIVEQAITRTAGRRHAAQADRHAEIEAVTGQIAAANAAIDRHLAAFETGALPESVCGPRIAALAATIEQLSDRRTALEALTGHDLPPALGHDEHAALHAGVRDALATGDPPRVKAVLDALIADIRVHSRDHIQPVFRLPFD